MQQATPITKQAQRERELFDEGYSEGYNAALDDNGQRIPFIATLAAVAVLFALGWLAGHYGP
jgi:hypothetical protein